MADKSQTNPMLFSEEAEKRVLTNILHNNGNYYTAGNLLTASLFYNDKNARLFEEIRKGISDGKTVDVFHVATEAMRKHDDLSYTPQDILLLFSDYISDVMFGQDLEYLRELAKRREYWTLGQRLIRIGTDMSYSADMAVKEITRVLDDNGDDGNGVMTLKEANAQLMERVVANHSGKSDTYLATGFAVLDSSGGFQLGDFDVIAADSSMGKTAFVTKIMENTARKGNPCMSYSMEMMAWQLAARINASKANTPANVIQYKDLTEYQYRDLQLAMEDTDTLPIYFDDKSTTSVDAIIASIRLNAKRHGIKFFVVDYLQILSSVGAVNDRVAFLGDTSRRFKNLAKELNVNITVLSQLARNNQDPRPTLSRVRASGEIVEAADTVLLIWRPSMYGKASYKDSNAPVGNTAEIIIGKGRNIGTGSFIVHFEPTTTNFYDATADERRQWSKNGGTATADDELPPPPLSKDENAPF